MKRFFQLLFLITFVFLFSCEKKASKEINYILVHEHDSQEVGIREISMEQYTALLKDHGLEIVTLTRSLGGEGK